MGYRKEVVILGGKVWAVGEERKMKNGLCSKFKLWQGFHSLHRGY